MNPLHQESLASHSSHRLAIEDAKGLEANVEVLTDIVIQVTMRKILYLKLPKGVYSVASCLHWSQPRKSLYDNSSYLTLLQRYFYRWENQGMG